MARRTSRDSDLIDDPEDTGQGPYDPAPVAEEDLWFLPGPGDADPEDADLPPLPRADRRPLVDVAAWAAAEAGHAAELGRVAALFGALDERLRQAPQGWRQRLALREVVTLSWQAGDRVTADRLALWSVLRLPGPQDEALPLARAAWALRRLETGLDPQKDLVAFLDRRAPSSFSDTDPASGAPDEGLPARIGDWQQIMARTGALHPLTRGALAQQAWLAVGSATGALLGAQARAAGQEIEAAVLGARLAAADTRGGMPFLPLALGVRPGQGDPSARLASWLGRAGQGCLAALLHLERLDAWEHRARQAIAGRSGRTPPRLVRELRDWPLLSAPLAEAQTGASRAAVQRNLAWLERKGLIREVTGQGRYRFWAAEL